MGKTSEVSLIGGITWLLRLPIRYIASEFGTKTSEV